MAIFREPTFEITDDYCGLYNVEDKRRFFTEDMQELPMSLINMPKVGDKGTFKVISTKAKYKIFEGEVIGKYGEDHILVRNLNNDLRESYFKREFLTKEVLYRPIECL